MYWTRKGDDNARCYVWMCVWMWMECGAQFGIILKRHTAAETSIVVCVWQFVAAAGGQSRIYCVHWAAIIEALCDVMLSLALAQSNSQPAAHHCVSAIVYLCFVRRAHLSNCWLRSWHTVVKERTERMTRLVMCPKMLVLTCSQCRTDCLIRLPHLSK